MLNCFKQLYCHFFRKIVTDLVEINQSKITLDIPALLWWTARDKEKAKLIVKWGRKTADLEKDSRVALKGDPAFLLGKADKVEYLQVAFLEDTRNMHE